MHLCMETVHQQSRGYVETMEKRHLIPYVMQSIHKGVRGKRIKDTLLEDKSNYLYQLAEQYEKKLNCIEMYEKKWLHLRQMYSEIDLYGIKWVSIGEAFVRLYRLIWDIQEEASENRLKVVLPIFFSDYNSQTLFNNRIFDVFSEYLYFVNEANIELWKYIFKYHKEDINTRQFNKYYARSGECVLLNSSMPVINFPRRELAEAQKKMNQMGITGEYICLHARDDNVKKKNFSIERARQTSARNCDINTFRKASVYLQGKGLQSIRMGKYEKQQCVIPGIIDYAGKYQDDLMDFYLVAHCKFIIGCDSGLTNIATYWRVPFLMTNQMMMSYGYEGEVYIQESMYMPKKLWSEKEKRYLNLRERFCIESKYDISEHSMEDLKLGITIEDNTEDEIYQAAVEMYERLNGTWVEGQEEKEAMSRYWEIFSEWKTSHRTVPARRRMGLKGYSMCPIKISWNFLKDNMYLLG